MAFELEKSAEDLVSDQPSSWARWRVFEDVKDRVAFDVRRVCRAHTPLWQMMGGCNSGRATPGGRRPALE